MISHTVCVFEKKIFFWGQLSAEGRKKLGGFGRRPKKLGHNSSISVMLPKIGHNSVNFGDNIAMLPFVVVVVAISSTVVHITTHIVEAPPPRKFSAEHISVNL